MPNSEIDMRVEAHLFSGLGGWLRFLSRGTRILEKMVDALPYEADTRQTDPKMQQFISVVQTSHPVEWVWVGS